MAQTNRTRAILSTLLFLSLTAPPAAATPPKKLFTATELRADLSALYEGLKRAHFNLYARVSKSSYDQFYERALKSFDEPLPEFEAAARFQRFTAFGRIAHARIDTSYAAFAEYLTSGGKAFPLTLRVVNDRAFVSENKSGLDSLKPGDELLTLDGKPIRFWLDRCARNLSADTSYMAAALMELDFPMLLWLERGSVAQFEITTRRGRIVVPSRKRAEMAEAREVQPPRLDLTGTERSWKMIEPGIGYLRPGPFYNVEAGADIYDNRSFGAFIDRAFHDLIEGSAKSLIIDLRDNPGGDSSFSDLMISWFASRPFRFNSAFLIKVSPEAVDSNVQRLAASPPGSMSHRFAALYAAAKHGEIVRFDTPYAQPREGVRFGGRVYLLVNRNSYSNAVAVAATVQDYRFGAILGEETSDLATTYGAMESFTLPLTGLKVGFPKAHIIRPSGDTAPRGVRPDVAIESPIFEGPEDPVLNRATSIVRKAAVKLR